MIARQPAHSETWRPLALILTVAVLFMTLELDAQEMPEPESPNREPGSSETLFDQSDLGNVAQTARSFYHSGIRSMNQAGKLEEKLQTIADDKRESLRKKVAKAYESAAQSFTEAIAFDADLIEAYNGLGSAYRHLGKYQQALQVHSAGLQRSPDDLENFAGWAESLLALNLLGNATSAYSGYLESHPERARILMTAMKTWLDAKRQDPGDLDPADVERLAEWIARQEQGPG